jgi:hypothetical protein
MSLFFMNTYSQNVKRNIAQHARKRTRQLREAFEIKKEYKPYIIKGIIYGFVVGAVLLVRFVVLMSLPTSADEKTSIQSAYTPLLASTNYQNMKVGLGTQGLLDRLKSDGFDPVTVGTMKRPPLSIDGTLVSFSGDTIGVFEYGDSGTAKTEAQAIITQNNNGNGNQNAWKDRIHIYTKDSLVIYYMGTKENIINALDKFTGTTTVQKPAN